LTRGWIFREENLGALAQHTPSGTNPGRIYAQSSDPSHAGAIGGVEMADLVVLLDHYGIKSTMAWTAGHPEQTGMPALQQDLRDGRKVIAWVNSAVVWNTSDQRTKADHYLVVTGDRPPQRPRGGPRRRAGPHHHLHECLAHRRGIDRRHRGTQLSGRPNG
jgi:hypothetical protein